MSNPKEVAGRKAAEYVRDGMVVGLGTGSTVHFTLLCLAERMQSEGLRFRGVPTSVDTETKARAMGMQLTSLAEVESIDLTIDGADEIDSSLRMIKGGGGALLREKVIASISRREVIVVGADKVVGTLGRMFPLPVETVPFARPVVERAIKKMGATTTLRVTGAGNEYHTDNGNVVLDCHFLHGIQDPEALERKLALMPGVVESGLFINLAHVLVTGHADGSAQVREKS